MVESPKRRQAQTGGVGQESTVTTGTISVTPPMPVPEIPEEVRTELTSLMQDLLLKTHELSFEYSTLDCPSIQTCPLAMKCREIFKVVKKLNEVVKTMGKATGKPSYMT